MSIKKQPEIEDDEMVEFGMTEEEALEIERQECVQNFERLERGLQLGVDIGTFGVSAIMRKLFSW